MRSGRAIALLAASLVLTACGGGESSAPIAAQDAPDVALATAQALSGKAGKVVWTPGAINVTVFQGTSTSFSVTLRAGEQVDDASIFVASALDGLLKLSLRGASAVPATTDINVPLQISAPATMPPGTYEGTVHLRSRQRTVPSTLKVRIQVVTGSADVIPTTPASPSPDRVARADNGVFLVKDEVLVALQPNVADADAAIKRIASEVGAVILGSVPEVRIYQLRVTVADLNTLPQYLANIRSKPSVKSASRNLFFTASSITADPNDPYFKGKWSRTAAGDLNRHLEYVRAQEAWDITTGNAAGGIAVLDEAFDVDHPDLSPNIRVTPDVEKFTFTPATLPADNNAAAHASHGTAVAGTACASGNNKTGVVGMAWACDLRLVQAVGKGNLALTALGSVVWFLDCLSPSTSWPFLACQNMRSSIELLAAMVEAVNQANNARVIVVSSNVVKRCTPPTSPLCTGQEDIYVQDANDVLEHGIDFSKNHPEIAKQNVLWAFAAGNDKRDVRLISPASLVALFPERIIVVAAVEIPDNDGPLTANDGKEVDLSDWSATQGSNFGPRAALGVPGIDVAAPGTVTTLRARMCDPKADPPCDDGIAENVSGTSYSAPIVAGLAHLVWGMHTEKSVSEVKSCIINAAQQFGTKVKHYDFHVINAVEAVKCTPPIPVTITTHPANVTVDEGAAATFSVVAAGSPPLTYQWKKNGEDIPKATSASYTILKTTAADNNSEFTVRVSNGGTPVLSNPARLTVRPAQPQIGIAPLSQDFGGQQLGTPSAAKSFSITNTGSAPLIISSVTSEGDNRGDFAITSQPCTQAPLAPAGSCTVSVVFTPSALGARSALLSITDNAAGAPHSAGLAGTGLDGPPPPPTPGDVQVLIDGLMWTDAIALDGEWVYFGTGIGAGVDNKWVLNRVSRDGTKPQLALATDPVGFPGPGFPRLYKIAFTATKVVVGAMTPTGYTIWSVDKSTWQVQQIVTGVGPLVTAYGDHAYYGGDGRLSNQFFRISLSNPADVVGVGGSYGYGQLLDPPFLYYGYGSGELSRFNLNTGEHTFIRSFGIYLYQATLSGDSDYIYYPQVACSNHGVIWRVSKSPPFAAEVLLEGDPLTYPVAFGAAPAGQYVYYLENNIPCLSGQDLNLRAVSKVDKTVTPVLLSHIGGQYGLMSDGSAIYWYEGGNPSKIWKFPKSAK